MWIFVFPIGWQIIKNIYQALSLIEHIIGRGHKHFVCKEQLGSLSCIHVSAAERMWNVWLMGWGGTGPLSCDVDTKYHSLVAISMRASQRQLKFNLVSFPESIPSLLLLQGKPILLRNLVVSLDFSPPLHGPLSILNLAISWMFLQSGFSAPPAPASASLH